MICSVRSASCQTVKPIAMATVAASAHHWVRAGFLALVLALVVASMLVLLLALVARVSRKEGQAAGSWRMAK